MNSKRFIIHYRVTWLLLPLLVLFTRNESIESNFLQNDLKGEGDLLLKKEKKTGTNV